MHKQILHAAPLLCYYQLAIVSMADQFTRIANNGSPLETSAPVVGLLFGRDSDSGTTTDGPVSSSQQQQHRLEICDAVDIPSGNTEATTTSTNYEAIISLHQAVYTKHRVVGCYRVVEAAAKSSTAEPTGEDLDRVRALGATNALFLLLQVRTTMANDEATNPTLKREEEDQSPSISIFQLDDNGGSAALVFQPDWQLETALPEKIAVERVLQEQDQPTKSASSPISSLSVRQKQLHRSLSSLHERLQIIEQYIAAASSMPPDPTLLRKIQALLLKAQMVGKKKHHTTSTEDGNHTSSDPSRQLLREIKALSNLAGALQEARQYNESSVLKTTTTTPAASSTRRQHILRK